MKKWIRWQGLGAFVIIVIIVFGFWYLFIDGIVKRTIEKQATKAMGAKVELKSADLTLFPAGLHVSHLQVTNPDDPMKNAVEIARINLSLETAHLLRRKIIVKEVLLDGIQLNTPRKTSGALVTRAPAPPVSKKEPQEKIILPTFSVPDVTEILKREELESLNLAKSLQADIQKGKDTWRMRLNELPDREKFDKYRSRIQQLKKKKKKPFGGLLGAAGDIAAIKKDITNDLNRIKQARQGLNHTLASLKGNYDKVKKAPLKDFERLKKKYSISAQGIANMSGLLFGSRINDWTQTAVRWYERLQPLLEGSAKKRKHGEPGAPVRGKGVNISFKEKEPLPDFLIRTVNARLHIEAGDLAGTIKDITNRQDILGIPLTFLFSGENMKGLTSLNFRGALDHINDSSTKDTVNFTVQGLAVRDIALSKGDQMPITLNNAAVDLDLKALIRGDTIVANLISKLDSVSMATGEKEKGGVLMSSIASALSTVSSFTLKADITGTLDKYTATLDSDLDDVLKKAAGKAVGKQAAQLEKDLKKGIFAKVDGPLGQAKKSLGGFDGISGELAQRGKLGNSLMKDLRLPF